MTQKWDRFLLSAQLRDFSVLVLHHAVLLLLTHLCGGQSEMIGPPQLIVGIIGGDIILPCHLEPPADVTGLTVEWARSDLNPRFVHLRRDGVELLLDQNSLYTGRTSLSSNKLKTGDISLKLSNVKISDAGTYKCLVPKFGAESAFEVVVGAVSSPDVEISTLSNAVVLDCKSKGWYPEPEVLWLDGEGNLLSAGPTETVRGPDDLYTVSSRVTVEKRHSNSFTCRVQQNKTNQTTETHIHIKGIKMVDNIMMWSLCQFHVSCNWYFVVLLFQMISSWFHRVLQFVLLSTWLFASHVFLQFSLLLGKSAKPKSIRMKLN
uniref:Ig-like domain-containing protein n=1 Tax=Lates calcarifer TaxID=8187 RepID=A0A4W6BXH4_LATCA